MSKEKSTALATIENVSAFPVLNPETSEEALDVIKENMGTAGLSISNLTSVSIPTGGNLSFMFDDGDGDAESRKSFTGIIIYAPEQKGLWLKSYDEDPNAAPSCWSNDRITGEGDPFETGVVGRHSCATCPKNVWGSNPNNRGGKACRDLRPLFTLMEGEFLPIVIKSSPTSQKHISRFFSLLSRKGIPHYAAMVEVFLAKESEPAPAHSVLNFKLLGIVPKELRAAIKLYKQAIETQATKPPTVSEAGGDEQVMPDGGNVDTQPYDPFEDESGSMRCEVTAEAVVTNPGTGSIIDQ